MVKRFDPVAGRNADIIESVMASEDVANLADDLQFKIRLCVEEVEENILCYSGSTWVEVETSVENGQLIIEFRDGGIAFDPLDGGIAKDYCNISYLLCTGGMASLVTSAFTALENKGHNGGILGLCGQNPMIAYTIVSGFISPVLYACGLLGLLDSLGTGNIFWGLTRGVVITAAMCLCTAFFTKKKIFWRS